jgi:AAA15 family ATPase/GTPase
MLLNYSIENYKSIKEKETINFLAKPLKQHEEHLLNEKILPVIALYGPNGGGKTAILESIKECQILIYEENMFFIPKNKSLENLKNDKLKPIK